MPITDPGTGLVRRATVTEIVTRRNRALSLYSAAHDAIEKAEAALKKAREAEVAGAARARPVRVCQMRQGAQAHRLSMVGLGR